MKCPKKLILFSGFLANLANLLNDAEAISSHKETDTKESASSIAEAHEKKTIIQNHEETPAQPQHTENSDKKDVIDLSLFASTYGK